MIRLFARCGWAAIAFVGCSSQPTSEVSSLGGELPGGAQASASSVVVEEKQAARTLDQTFDDIKFDIEPGDPFDRSMLTDSIRDLDGRVIRIRGYILPTARQRGIRQFVLVRDNQECCFGPGAALYDCLLVTMNADKTAEFSVRPVAVEGKFTIEEFYGPDGTPLAIYRLAGDSVE